MIRKDTFWEYHINQGKNIFVPKAKTENISFHNVHEMCLTSALIILKNPSEHKM